MRGRLSRRYERVVRMLPSTPCDDLPFDHAELGQAHRVTLGFDGLGRIERVFGTMQGIVNGRCSRGLTRDIPGAIPMPSRATDNSYQA